MPGNEGQWRPRLQDPTAKTSKLMQVIRRAGPTYDRKDPVESALGHHNRSLSCRQASSAMSLQQFDSDMGREVYLQRKRRNCLCRTRDRPRLPLHRLNMCTPARVLNFNSTTLPSPRSATTSPRSATTPPGPSPPPSSTPLSKFAHLPQPCLRLRRMAYAGPCSP